MLINLSLSLLFDSRVFEYLHLHIQLNFTWERFCINKFSKPYYSSAEVALSLKSCNIALFLSTAHAVCQWLLKARPNHPALLGHFPQLPRGHKEKISW